MPPTDPTTHGINMHWLLINLVCLLLTALVMQEHEEKLDKTEATMFRWMDVWFYMGRKRRKKVKEADLYSAFIEVPYTQGIQVWITPANYTVPASTS